MYMQAQNFPGDNTGLGEIDWSGIIKDVVGGYAAVKTVQSQTKLAEQQAQQAQQAQQLALQYQLNPQYSGQYSTGAQSSNLMPLLLIGGAVLAVFFLMKD